MEYGVNHCQYICTLLYWYFIMLYNVYYSLISASMLIVTHDMTPPFQYMLLLSATFRISENQPSALTPKKMLIHLTPAILYSYLYSTTPAHHQPAHKHVQHSPSAL